MVQLQKSTKKIIITKSPKGGITPGRGLLGQILLGLLVLFFLASLYSVVTDSARTMEEISISTLAQDVTVGNVSSIVVVDDKLEIIYLDGTEKVAKKETGTPLSTTLSNYEVDTTALAKVNIEVRDDRGFFYWFISLAPILLPIFFILFFLW